MVAGYASAGPAAFWLRYTGGVEGASFFLVLFLLFLNQRLSDWQSLELISPGWSSSLPTPRIQSPF